MWKETNNSNEKNDGLIKGISKEAGKSFQEKK